MEKETNEKEEQGTGFLDKDYWDKRWKNKETGWDIGYPSPAIIQYVMQGTDKNAALLIPGCGNAYEAEFLVDNGFNDITLLDISEQATVSLKEKFAGWQTIHVLCENYFSHQGVYDLIIEQTFFCALPPTSRTAYVERAASLLRPGGRIAGVLFNTTFEQQGPPFGGHEEEYRQLFEPSFTIRIMEECRNSITPRAGSELFIELVRK